MNPLEVKLMNCLNRKSTIAFLTQAVSHALQNCRYYYQRGKRLTLYIATGRRQKWYLIFWNYQ